MIECKCCLGEMNLSDSKTDSFYPYWHEAYYYCPECGTELIISNYEEYDWIY